MFVGPLSLFFVRQRQQGDKPNLPSHLVFSFYSSLSLSLSFSPTHTLTHTFSITAALYLQEFVPEGTDWAHIDMAGPVWDEKEGGATGFGVGTLAQYAVSRSS